MSDYGTVLIFIKDANMHRRISALQLLLLAMDIGSGDPEITLTLTRHFQMLLGGKNTCFYVDFLSDNWSVTRRYFDVVMRVCKLGCCLKERQRE